MKGRLLKKAAALALAAMLVTGSVPVQPIADLAREISITASAAGETILVSTDTDFAMLYGSNYSLDPQTFILQNDIELQGRLDITQDGDFVIDLNGHSLKRSSSGSIIYIDNSDSKLTIKDSSEGKTGEITGGYSSAQGTGIYNQNGTVVFLGGKVTGNIGTEYGSGAGVYNKGTFIMLGGEISGNSNTYSGIKTDNVRNNGNFYILNTLPAITAFDGTAAKRIGCSVNTAVTGKGTFTAAPTTITAEGQTYTVSGEPVTLNVTPNENYVIESVKYNDGSDHTITSVDGNYSFTMPESDVTVSVVFVLDPAHLSQDGDNFTIHDETGWEYFCDCLDDNDTYNRFSGKTVLLDADITVSRMAGYSNHDFCGTFNGQGHTLTFNYGTNTSYSSEEYIAPFRYVSNTKANAGDAEDSAVTIKNLHVNGDIYTSNKYAAGLIAQHWGTVNIENCRSSINIHSNVDIDDNKDGTHGGFVGVQQSGTLNITGCVFDGKLLTTNGTEKCAGFVGWRKSGDTGLKDCIYAPAAADQGETWASSSNSAAFVRNPGSNVSFTNCWYTEDFNDGTNYTAQGTKAYAVSAGENVTLDYGEAAEDYNVSGITVYADNTGLKFDGSFLAAKDSEITFTAKPPKRFKIKTLSVSAGTLTGEANPYTLTMPEENVTVDAELESTAVSVDYLDENGDSKTTIAYPIDSSDSTLEGGWFVVNSDVTIEDQLELTGDVNLILADDFTLNLNNRIYGDDCSLTIYAQSLDNDTAGELVLNVGDNNNDSIKPIDIKGSYTQNGGNVTINSTYYSEIGNDLILNNGKLLFSIHTDMMHSADVYGRILLNGGTIIADDTITYFGSIDSKGGIILAGAEVRLNQFGPNRFTTEGPAIAVAEGLNYTDGVNVYDSSTEDNELERLSYTTLVTAKIVTADERNEHVTVVPDRPFVADKDTDRTVTLSFITDPGYRVKNIYINGELLEPAGGVYSFEMPNDNVVVSVETYHFVGANVTLNGYTDTNFYFDLTSEEAQNAKITFEYEGKEPFEAGITYDPSTEYYKATCPVPAAHMASEITMKLYLGGEFKEAQNYSVKEYAESVMSQSIIYPAELPLLKAMLNYGASAQVLFDVNTSNPANGELTDEDKALGDVTIDKTYTSTLPDTIKFSGATLILDHDTTLSLMFESSEQLTFECEGYTVETKRYTDYQVARIRNLCADELQNDFTLQVKSGSGDYSVTYSPLNYIKNALNSNDADLANTAKALYHYSVAASYYLSHYTISYDLNGVEQAFDNVTIACGDAVELPAAENTSSLIFEGWYTKAEGGDKVGNGGDSYTPSSNIRLYAHWREAPRISTSTSNSSITLSVKDNSSSDYTTIQSNDHVMPGSVVKVGVSHNGSNNQSFSIVSNGNSLPYYSDEACTSAATSQGNGTYYFIMPDADVTVSARSEAGWCVVKGTIITLADGTAKPVEQVEPGDELLVWDPETGRYDSSPVVFNDAESEAEYTVIHTCFSDGTVVGVVSEHGFFDVTLGKYVYISEDTLTDYLGHTFIKQGDIGTNSWETVTLTDVWTETIFVEVYSPVTFHHLCYYTNGLLSMPGGINGLFNIFDVDTATMTYDADKMQADIEAYGLFTYEDFGGVVSEGAYYAYNGAWLKVAIGKGMLTFEDIERLAQRYGKFY